MRFTVLASGSIGNASLVQNGVSAILLDIGLGPRQLASRLATAGASWRDVHAVILTHVHGDHWHHRTLLHLAQRAIPLWCHAHHRAWLRRHVAEFAEVETAGLVRCYDPAKVWSPVSGLRVRALPVRHDGGPTFGFRLEGTPGLFGQRPALAYVADLGCWTYDLAQALANVDLLALEFNHDVALEQGSGRSARLIARILSDDGHLSNEQAAALLAEVVRRSTPGRLKYVVQLHLSSQCNRASLARGLAQAVLGRGPEAPQLHTAGQHAPTPTFDVTARP
ncbi:MAG: MBL fold metallo-hydrolase [Gemmataceae bacterium]|nr:MBL fold metallo-hydrolase [Gemmataceae bacterium]MDW8263698.1 MBL fold metallo-hydrolase [Gemmataceae bacterium]